jgi:malic enzyme
MAALSPRHSVTTRTTAHTHYIVTGKMIRRGNIGSERGSEAALTVMQGKAALCQQFATVNARPVCLDTE